MSKLVPFNTTEVKRSYYLNLFSGNAEKTTNAGGTKNVMFKWNIRDLQLGSIAEIALVQMVHTAAVNTIGYALRCYETYQDGFDSYNQTSAILYLGLGLNTPAIATYHKLISNNKIHTISTKCQYHTADLKPTCFQLVKCKLDARHKQTLKKIVPTNT